MNYYNPYSQPSSTPLDSNTHSKKYSLRRRYQNPLREQLDRSKYLRYQQGSFFQGFAGQREDGFGGDTQEEGMGFNCMESAQRILDFNHPPPPSLKNHTKTLSTTPSSFQNPFAHQQHPTSRLQDKKSLVSSREQLNPSHAKSQKTAVSHKMSHNSSKIAGERLRTQNNSQPLSTVNYGMYDDASQGEKRGKVSLKHTHKFSSQSKSELLICLKYSDLKQPIATNKPGRFSVTPLDSKQNNTSISKYLCSTLKQQGGGCNCQPKCFWMDRWLNVIRDEELPSQQLPASLQEWENTLKQIEKDLPRTQPESPTFQIPQYINILREVLVGYARIDWQVGYVQGMNFIAAAIVYHSRSSYQALRVMEYLMRQRGFRKILIKDLAMSHLVSKRCLYELKRLAFDLYNHFINQQVQMQVFITGWYFSLLGSFVPLASMHLIIDKFLRSQFTGLNEIIITLLIYLKGQLLMLTDHSLMLAFSSQQIAATASKIDWEELVARSEHLLLDPLPY